MERENCWVWFKGSLKEGGVWKGGFTYKKDANPGVLIQNPLMYSVEYQIGV